MLLPFRRISSGSSTATWSSSFSRADRSMRSTDFDVERP
jgi:hypothetical protein